MRNRKSIDALSLGAIFVAAGIVGFSVWSLPPSFKSDVYPEIGRSMAREALSGAPRDGVVLIARDTKTYSQPAMDGALRAIENEVERAGLTMTTKLVSLDPLRPAEVPPGDFYEAIRRAKPGQVIVSLLGPPVLEPEQRAKLGTTRPKIIALCTGNLSEQTDLRGLFQEDFLHAAIVRRVNAGATSSAASEFDRLYEVLRKDEVLKGATESAKKP